MDQQITGIILKQAGQINKCRYPIKLSEYNARYKFGREARTNRDIHYPIIDAND